MKRKFIVVIIALFAITASGLLVVQIVQTNRTISISDNLFNTSVSHAMDDVIDQLNRLKMEDYINKTDRYKLLKYKRIEDLNTQMKDLVKNNASLFFDETRVHFNTVLQDSIVPLTSAKFSSKELESLNRYNTLLSNRNILTNGSEFYDQFVNELSEYVIDNLLSNNTFKYELLDTLITEKLIDNGIDIDPAIGVMNTSGDRFLYCSDSSVMDDMRLSPYRYSFHPNGIPSSNDYYITLLFPKTVLFLKDDLSVYLDISILLILIIFILFAISVKIITNQRKLDEMKNDFISNMTHEIKTPIASISLACEMLQDKSITCDETSRDTYVGMISNENRRMRVLVETILQSSKMSNKNFTMHCQPIDIHPIIEKVMTSFSLAINSRKGTMTCDLNASPSILYADELHVTNLIYNLLDNAIKYSPNELIITISTKNEGNYLVLSVTDQGLGISNEDQKHIFEKFYRVSTGNVHNVKGFGIGLNYVMHVVTLHHGHINVDSELGKGTTFSVYLPLA